MFQIVWNQVTIMHGFFYLNILFLSFHFLFLSSYLFFYQNYSNKNFKSLSDSIVAWLKYVYIELYKMFFQRENFFLYLSFSLHNFLFTLFIEDDLSFMMLLIWILYIFLPKQSIKINGKKLIAIKAIIGNQLAINGNQNFSLSPVD